ncbi:MAG: mechanosensitive ion channel [Bacteroidota bacterium]|nr:mechanosensitive ion channel [Bacteroidota bacterium]
MHDFLEKIWLGNTIRSYGVVLAVILFIWAFKRYISRYFAGLIFRVVNRVWKNLDKTAFIKLVVQPLGLFLFILVSIIALHKLKFPEELNADLYDYSIKIIIHCIGTIILIISFIWLLLRMIDFISFILEKKADLTPDQTDNQLVVFFRDFFKIIIFIIGILMILKFAFRFDIGNMLTGLSIVGAAVALALRESLENLIASFIIFFDKPFTLGDVVKVQNITGSIEKIGLRSTRIRTDQKTFVTVPNKQMVDSILDNLSQRTQRRGDLKLELGLQTPAAKLELLLSGVRKIIQARKEIEDANVYVSDITGQAIVLLSDYYTAPVTIKEFNTVKQDINLQVLKLLEELSVEIAGASTDIRIAGSANG